MLLKYIYAKNMNEYNEMSWDDKSCRINHFDQIPSRRYQMIIIMSQLDQDDCQWIKNNPQYDYLFFIGVRDYLEGENTRRFANEVQLKQAIDWAQNRQKVRQREWFVSQLPIFDEADESYLKSALSEREERSPEAFFPLKKKQAKRLKKGTNQKTFNPLRSKRKPIKGMICLMSDAGEAVQVTEALKKEVTGKILLVDGDLLKPSLDMYYGINHVQSQLETHLLSVDATGFNVLHDAIHKKMSLDDYIDEMVYPIDSHLDLLLGNYNFYNYEHYHLHYFQVMLDYLKNQYDLVIIKCPYEIYDEFTLLALILSDLNLFIASNQLADVRYLYQLKALLEMKQEIPEKKNVFVFHQEALKKRHVLANSYSSNALSLLFKKQYGGLYNLRQVTHLLKRRLMT